MRAGRSHDRSVTRLISRIRLSALKRGSFAQSTRKRKNATRLSVCPGPALMNTGFSFGARAVVRRVTHGAVVADARKADGLLGEADRQFVPLFPRDAERGVAAGTRQLLGKHARQHVEDPVRDAGVALAADRAVAEAHLRAWRSPSLPAALRGRTCTSRRTPSPAPRTRSSASQATTLPHLQPDCLLESIVGTPRTSS